METNFQEFKKHQQNLKQLKMRKLLITSLSILIAGISFSQETKRDTLKTEEISVVKPYTPKISAAFKVKSNPSSNETQEFPKEKVVYSIFSIPVASTFTPSKGKAKGVVRAKKERLYENYISAGFGNFTSPIFEAYLHTGDPRYNDFGIFINHHSSEGGIKNLLLNDYFSDTRIDGYFKQFERDFNWQVNIGVQQKIYNYYGLSTDITFENAFLDSLDEEQIYKNIYAGGKIDFEDSFFQGASAEFITFSDNYNTNELRLLVKPSLEFPISTELINAEFTIDLLTGKFKQNYFSDEDLKHSFLNLGFNPNFEVLRENLTVNLGAKLYYTNNLETKVTEFYAYPNVTASFKIVDEVLIIVAGVTGDLIQNTYQEFANENPYISPTLNIKQTDKQYKAFIGTKGKLASNIGYNFNVRHTYEKNKPLFIQNQTKTDGNLSVLYAYEAGNSFDVIYDDIKTLSVFAEITIDASKEFNFNGAINYNNYTTNNQPEVWNLPEITATITTDYQNNNWFAGAKLFYTGETKDVVTPLGILTENGTIIINESYIDLNLNGGYIFSDRLTAFAKINNALGKKYQPFVNYHVQTLQILGGITYKFDL
ncbi:MAG: TonB-dependent receptor [Lutibacter sp.]|nr:MAG: TonB-dependent receptor [Lutibacter sp.]